MSSRQTTLARIVTVIEAGIGFGFLGLVITYLPILYQAFSRREVPISLLDARAGSPPRAVELIRRLGEYDDLASLRPLLIEWERWCGELLESMLSYPSLAYFRSQHDNQSWLAALTMMLDVSALLLVGVEGAPVGPARLVFAMAPHAIVDICQYLNTPPIKPTAIVCHPSDVARMRAILAANGVPLRDGRGGRRRPRELRHLYEPFVNGAATALLLTLPPVDARPRRQGQLGNDRLGRCALARNAGKSFPNPSPKRRGAGREPSEPPLDTRGDMMALSDSACGRGRESGVSVGKVSMIKRGKGSPSEGHWLTGEWR